MKSHLLLVLVALFSVALGDTTIVAKDIPTDWQQCVDVDGVGNVCVHLSFDSSDKCSVEASLTVLGLPLFTREVNLELDPLQCVGYGGCQICVLFEDIENQESTGCVSVFGQCSTITLPHYEIGCFDDSELQECFTCPSNCSGHGTCTDGVCTCDSGFEGFSCAEATPFWKQCKSIPLANKEVCTQLSAVTDDICSMSLNFLFDDTVIYRNTLEVYEIVQNPKYCLEIGDEGVCLNFKDYTVIPTKASGSVSLDINLLGTELGLNMGSFSFNSDLSDCGHKCLNDCNSKGTCVEGVCQCADGWYGEDCTLEECPADCNDHGTCELGICTCFAGYSGPACNEYVCDSVPCIHGTCIASNNCQCEEGYTGDSCDKVVATGSIISTGSASNSLSAGSSPGTVNSTKKYIIIGVVSIVVLAVVGIVVFGIYKYKLKKREMDDAEFSALEESIN